MKEGHKTRSAYTTGTEKRGTRLKNTPTDPAAARAERRRMMLEEPIIRILPIVALPMVLSTLIDSFYNLADTYFVSTLGTAATAAVGVNNSLMHFIRAMGIGFGMGAASYISRLLGAKRDEEASRVASTTALVSGMS